MDLNLLGYYTVLTGVWLPTFRGRVVISKTPGTIY